MALNKSLKTAFATNDLKCICRAVDAAACSYGLTRMSQDAKIDRATLFRAFRRENGPSLATMVRLLACLGFRLIVEMKDQQPKPLESRSDDLSTKMTSLYLATACKSDDLRIMMEAFAEVLSWQVNVSEVARNTIRWRESLYRAFEARHVPRFSTVLSFLDAIGLRFSVEPVWNPQDERTLAT